MLETFKKLGKEEIQELIKKEKIKVCYQNKEDKSEANYLFKTEVTEIINVLIILHKVSEYATAKAALASKDKQNINLIQSERSDKAFTFISNFENLASKELASFKDFRSNFEDLILKIEVQCDNGK